MRLLRGSVVLALFALFFSFVLQLQTAAPRQSGLGDWLDPYFINYLLEHWYHSLITLSDPTSPAMYFPKRGTLGYSHGLILYVPFYVAARGFLHPFQAYTASLFLMMTTGCLFLYAVLRRFLGLPFIEALLLTAFFATSGNIVNQNAGIWSQRLSVFLIPVIIYVALAAWVQSKRMSRVVLAAVFGCLPPLLFIQDSYTGQFTLLLSILLLAGVVISHRGALLSAPTVKRPSLLWLGLASISLVLAIEIAVHPIHRIRINGARIGADNPVPALLMALLAAGWFSMRRWQVSPLIHGTWHNLRKAIASRVSWQRDRAYFMAVTAGGVLGSVVFALIYLPTYLSFPGFPDWMITGALRPIEFRPGGWWSTLTSLFPYSSFRTFALVLLVAGLARVPRLDVDAGSRLAGLWWLGISAIVIAIPQQIGTFSIWKTFLMPLPGWAAIRNPDRMIEVYELGSILVVGCFLARQPTGSFMRRAIPTAILLLLLADWSPQTFVYKRPNGPFQQMVEAPITVDPSCQSFFILGASQHYMARADHMWALYSVDAGFIAINSAIPTLNGYSAWHPDGWELANPQEPDYLDYVARWIELNHLQNVCALDIEARTMSPYQVRR